MQARSRLIDNLTMGQDPARHALPLNVWRLGFVSLAMDVSSEMIHSLLPVFLVASLGASATAVGLIEGVAESTASITKVFSGLLSDRVRRRKPFALLGYGLGALAKPLFALAPTVVWVFTARFVDRVGKGIRGAPRDALLADGTPATMRGAAFGLRQALDTVGACAGPLIAMLIMLASNGSFRLVFWLAVIPAAASVWLLWRGVQEPPTPIDSLAVREPLRLRGLGRPLAALVAVAAAFSLARFSEAFLLLEATQAGLPPSYAPLVLILMNVSYAAVAYPVGRAVDRIGRWRLLAAGFALFVTANVLLAVSDAVSLVALGIVLWGLHLGFTQGVFAALVADAAPAALRGSAFGVFHAVTGLALLAASLIAGVIWDRFGSEWVFLGSAGLTLAAALLAGVFHFRGLLPRPAAC